jgi:molybdopterin molybdotransferase
MIDPDRALDLVLEKTPHRLHTDVSFLAALGLTLAEEVRADRDYPPFDRAAMDGFAMRIADAGRTVEIIGEVAAGQVPAMPVTEGRCAEIMTGAACPEGTEAVVMKEETERSDRMVTLPSSVQRGQHIAARGSESSRGSVLLEPGATIGPLAVAVLAAVGRERVRVRSPLDAVVITTGDELACSGAPPSAVQIRDSNGPMLAALAHQAGCREVKLLHARDTLGDLSRALSEASQSDVVLVTGGVSAGRYDLVPQALQAAGAELVFHQVTQKPGKPLLFAVRGPQLFFGLPGNPLSSHFCFHRYVRSAVRASVGQTPAPRGGRGRLARRWVTRVDRTLFALARVEGREEDLRITPLLGQGSADIFSAQRANAYLRLPPGTHDLIEGSPLDFEWTGG